MAIHHEVPVLIVGAGPSGLLTSLQVAKNGVRSMLVERNHDTTKWPKMDVTNVRSMEILKKLGVEDGIRSVGVPQEHSFRVLFSTGLSDKSQVISKWELESPNDWRKKINSVNDGTMPEVPPQRGSQAVVEAWLKTHIQANELIDSHFGLKFETLTESDDGVVSELVDESGEKHVVKSQYVIGCDGGGSRVRRSLGIELIGGPIPGAMMLIHFKSRDLNYLRRHGQFWHNFVSSGVALIAQDEVDTWTVHLAVPLDAKLDDFDPIEKIQTSLGGEFGAVPIKVDKILVKSFWRPNICIAKSFISPKGRAFLVGDAAHQNIPAGGYGMNTAVGDAFDIGWKVAAAVKGYAGAGLLQSYEEERKPVATRNIDRSGRHWSQLAKFWEMSTGTNGVVAAQTDEGKALRARIDEYMTTHDGENREHGIEMGYRYNGSSVIVPSDDPSKEPRWDYRQYVPSTWPGARAPHVFLEDGKTSVFSVLGQGPDYSLVDFSPDARFINKFKPAFESLGIPWVPVHLPNEPTVRKIWEREAVLVRPDQHVAWRTGETPTLDFDEREILATVIGLKSELGGVSEGGPSLTEGQGFLAVIGKAQPIGEGEHNDKYAAFQR